MNMDENLNNRALKPGRKPDGTQATVAAPPIAIPSRVAGFTCPRCGKAEHHTVKRSYPEGGYADVECKCCAAKLKYVYATATDPMPRIRYVLP